MKEENLRFSKRLKAAREALGYSITELSEITGVSVSTISRYEGNKIKKVDSAKVYVLADKLGLSPSWLSGLIESENPIYAENITSHPLKRGNKAEEEILKVYRNLNKKGKDYLNTTIKSISLNPDLVESTKDETDNNFPVLKQHINKNNIEIDSKLKAAHFDTEGKSLDQIKAEEEHDNSIIEELEKSST